MQTSSVIDVAFGLATIFLIFSLLVTPGAIADRVCRTPGRGIGMCVGLAVVLVWAGLVVTYYSSFPVGFVITALAFAAYLIARAVPSATPAPYHRS